MAFRSTGGTVGLPHTLASFSPDPWQAMALGPGQPAASRAPVVLEWPPVRPLHLVSSEPIPAECSCFGPPGIAHPPPQCIMLDINISHWCQSPCFMALHTVLRGLPGVVGHWEGGHPSGSSLCLESGQPVCRAASESHRIRETAAASCRTPQPCIVPTALQEQLPFSGWMMLSARVLPCCVG